MIIRIPLQHNYVLSVYRDDSSGAMECVPIKDGHMFIGDPVRINGALDLCALITAAYYGDYHVWQNEADTNDYVPILSVEELALDPYDRDWEYDGHGVRRNKKDGLA